jgi:diguanylate cyclase (GGDEF)-like protein
MEEQYAEVDRTTQAQTAGRGYEENPNNPPVATIDVVTGLPNRLCFQDRLGQAIRHGARNAETFAVLFIDLDDFKKVNDTMGHSTGDDLLREVAVRLCSCVRNSDTVARLGGDEFTVVLLDLKAPELIARVAEKIITSLREPFPINGRDFHLGASIGIAVYPDDGENAEMLVRNADTAMYEIKKSSKNGYCFYTGDMSARAIARMELEDDLRKGIAGEQFEVHYQPCVDAYSGRVVSAEALVRWRHPEYGLIMPDQFIGLAEETGLIVELGQWVLNTACSQARAWQHAGYEPISIAVNLSMLQFEQGDLVKMIMEALVSSNLHSRWLELELTEGVLLKNAANAKDVLDELRLLGIRIAIDDFGTGYSSLIQLKQLPIDCLKIDRAFIDGILSDNDDATVVEAIIALGRKLNLTLVAEGVEEPEQLEFLRSLGCQRCQGYLFGAPCPADQFSGFLTHSHLTQTVEDNDEVLPEQLSKSVGSRGDHGVITTSWIL